MKETIVSVLWYIKETEVFWNMRHLLYFMDLSRSNFRESLLKQEACLKRRDVWQSQVSVSCCYLQLSITGQTSPKCSVTPVASQGGAVCVADTIPAFLGVRRGDNTLPKPLSGDFQPPTNPVVTHRLSCFCLLARYEATESGAGRRMPNGGSPEAVLFTFKAVQ